MAVRLMRVYDAVKDPSGGRVYLVDGRWPRGVRRDALRLDDWLRDVAPTRALRTWFGHRTDRWAQFRRRYLEELAANPAATEFRRRTRSGRVTLLYGAKDTEHNNAVVLRDWLTGGG